MYINTISGLEKVGFEQGSRSSPEYIRWLQSSLNSILGLNLKVDGIMGSQTRNAIRTFQQKQGLVTDGVIGPKTEAALLQATRSATPEPVMTMSTQIIRSATIVNRKSRGYVIWVQSALNQIMGTSLKVDGISGPKTRNGIRSFQQARGLKVDGIVGPKTEDALRAAGAPSLPWEDHEAPVESALGALVSTAGCPGLSGIKSHLLWFEVWLNSCQADSLIRTATATAGVGTPICGALTLATTAAGAMCGALVGILVAYQALIAAANTWGGSKGVKVFIAYTGWPVTPTAPLTLFAIYPQ